MDLKTFIEELKNKMTTLDLDNEYLDRNLEDDVFSDVIVTIEHSDILDDDTKAYLKSESVINDIVKRDISKVIDFSFDCESIDTNKLEEWLIEHEGLEMNELVEMFIDRVFTEPMLNLSVKPQAANYGKMN